MLRLKVKLKDGHVDSYQYGEITPIENGEIYICSDSEAQAHGLNAEQYKTEAQLAALVDAGEMIWKDSAP